MVLGLLEIGTKIGVVGKSGSGKSALVDTLAFALQVEKIGAGDLMRKLTLEKFGNSNLDIHTGQMDLEMDREVDSRTSLYLKEKDWTGIIHGRVVRLLAQQLIRSDELEDTDYVNISMDCSPDIRAERALKKYRIQKKDPFLTTGQVKALQLQRDDRDFARLHTIYRDTHGLTRKGHLYQWQDTETHQGFNLNSGLMSIRQELFITLGVLHTLGKISNGRLGLNMAGLLGLCYCIAHRY